MHEGTGSRNGPHNNIQGNDNEESLVPPVSEINVCEDFICKILKTLKPSKATGPDDKLLTLAEPSITAPLTCLFTFSAHLGEPFPNGKKLGWFQFTRKTVKQTLISTGLFHS